MESGAGKRKGQENQENFLKHIARADIDSDCESLKLEVHATAARCTGEKERQFWHCWQCQIAVTWRAGRAAQQSVRDSQKAQEPPPHAAHCAPQHEIEQPHQQSIAKHLWQRQVACGRVGGQQGMALSTHVERESVSE